MKQLIMMDEQEFRAQVQSIVLKEISRSSAITNDLVKTEIAKLNKDINDLVIQSAHLKARLASLELKKESETGFFSTPRRSFQSWSYEEDQELKKDLQTFISIQANNHKRSYNAIICRIKRYYDTGEDV